MPLLCVQHTGKYLTIPRTEGISTTDIVGRMLLMTRDHHTASSAAKTVNDESGTNYAVYFYTYDLLDFVVEVKCISRNTSVPHYI